MPPQSPAYLSSDPQAGTSESEYLSMDPNAGTPLPTPNSPPAPSGGVGGFLSEATQGLNPRNINAAIQSAFWHPIKTGQGMLAAQDVPRQEALTAFQGGDYLTGTRKLIDWLIPVLGPRLDEAADYLQQGQTARGLGATTDVGLAIATPAIVRGTVGRLPTRAGIAQAAEAGAQRRVTEVIAPNVGAHKVRFGNVAADVAGDVARRTTARTRAGLLDEVTANAERANQALDAGYAAVPAGQRVSIRPVVAQLTREIRRLSVAGPRGTVIEPATRAAELASLRQALTELQGLGATTTLDNLRNLRQAWDQGAQAVFTPATTSDYLAARGAGSGWASARTVLNDAMVAAHPELRALNADASLWIRARDVLQAAEEVDRVRPRVGRSLMARGLGAASGGMVGGGWGAAFGAVIAPTIEAALAEASPVVKLTTARRLTQLADALRGGQPGPITAALHQVSAVLPTAERAAFMAQAVRLMRDLQPAAASREPAAPAPSPAGGPP